MRTARGILTDEGNRCVGSRWSAWLAALALALASARSAGTPHIPASDSQVLAELPAGARHATSSATDLSATRLDVALPLAQFDVTRARATGDLRFLGYAEAILAPWLAKPVVAPQVLVLDATIQQSRHAFDASLTELDRALAARPDDAQGWLTRATVLRVLGRYDEALESCNHLSFSTDAAVVTLCRQSLRGLMGHLPDAYAATVAIDAGGLPSQARAWRLSELGEMAARLGDDAAAERWFEAGLQMAPDDFYMRAALADVLLRQDRPTETLKLLADHQSIEPLLLRVAIAHRQLDDPALAQDDAWLADAFEVERRRGDAVHRRELARYLLDVDRRPAAALTAARENWAVQREPEDLLILLRAARAANQPDAAAGALEFLKRTGLEDARLKTFAGSYRATGSS